MNNDKDKRQKLAQQTAIKQTLDRMKRGGGAIRTDRGKLLTVLALLALLLGLWLLRHPLLGYTADSTLAPVNDLLLGLCLVLLTLAVPTALCWAWGGPWQAGKVQDNLYRAGLVNAIGEAPTLLSISPDPTNPNVSIYDFFTCGLPVPVWLNCADKIQTAINMTIVDVREGADLQHVLLSVVAPMTVWPTDLVYTNNLLPLGTTVLLLGWNAMGPVTLDLRISPHIMLAGATNSGKTTTLKVLLYQAFQHGIEVIIADFKGGVDFGKWFQEHCTLTYKLDGLETLLQGLMADLEERKRLFREAGCSDIDQYNRDYAPAIKPLKRKIFATDEAAFVLDKSNHTKEEKAYIERISSMLSVLTAQGRAFGLHVFLATQRPDAQIIPSFVRSNIDCRLCGRADKILSDIVLGSTIADEVIPKKARGRFVMNDGCGTSATVFQSYRLPDNIM